MSWFLDPKDADVEAERLNAVRRDDDVSYFVKIVRDRRGIGLPDS
jgi:hypothetical protein